jgi:hypothetical protein
MDWVKLAEGTAYRRDFMNNFWDKMSNTPLEINQSFGGTYRLHLQGQRIIHRGNHQAAIRRQNFAF